MTDPHVLLVEDDLAIGGELVKGLRRHGFQTSWHTDGDGAVERILTSGCDAVVLDLMLPNQHGFEILEALHDRVSLPVVVLTAGLDVDTRVQAFALGAADFVPKPFFVEELVARLRARLGGVGQTRRQIAWGEVVIDLDGRRALRAGTDVELTGHEFNVLAALVARPGRAMTREALCDVALTVDEGVGARTVDSHVARLRKKLGDDGTAVSTVWGVGYRFDPPGRG